MEHIVNECTDEYVNRDDKGRCRREGALKGYSRSIQGLLLAAIRSCKAHPRTKHTHIVRACVRVFVGVCE